MKTAFAIFCVLVCTMSACGHSAPSQARAVDGSYSFELLTVAHAEGDAEKQLWRFDDNVVVTAQSVARTDGLVRDRTLDDVAGAIATRYRLHEVPGTINILPCHVAGRDARCTDGSLHHGRSRLVRNGVLVPIGAAFVLFEVTGEESQRQEVERQRRILLRTLRVSSRAPPGVN